MKKSKKRISLLVAAVIAINLIFLGCGYAFVGQAKTALYDEKVNYVKEISLKTAQNIQSYINGYMTTVDAIAAFVSTHTDYDVEHILSILQAEVEKNSFKRMGVISPDGSAITTDGTAFNVSDRNYFHEAMQGKSAVSDRLLVDKVDGAEINVIASPVYRGGVVVGVIFATKTQEDFSQIMQVDSFDGEGYSYIITADGSPVVKTTHKNSVGDYTNLFDEIRNKSISNQDLNAMQDDIYKEKDGTFENHNKEVTSQIYYSKVGIRDWWLISVVPSKVISRQSDDLVAKLTVFTLLVVLLTSSLSFIIVLNLKKSNKTLEHIAYTDKVTGFLNWDKFCVDAKEWLDNNDHANFALVSLDINKFRVLNDLFGHSAGDTTLKSVAQIIAEHLRPFELFSRVSADKFTILMQCKDQKDVVVRIEQLAACVKNLIMDYSIELSVGIYLVEDKTLSIKILNDRADIARNIAKEKNDVFYSFFDEKNRIDVLREKEIENVMADALESGEFEVYLQPKFALETDSIIGAEALVRWNRKDVGLISPGEFIPLFEKNGFIRNIDLYMFEQVCSLLSKWNSSTKVHPVPISVNLSRIHLTDNKLPQKLLEIIRKYKVDPNNLEFELTESAIYSDTENIKTMMKKIRGLGIRLSIDDFGSGYSSLGTLRDLPIDVVKLDKSFFDNLLEDSKGKSIVGDILSMSKKLGLITVAEGVETAEQIEFLKGTACDIVQGFYYSKPVPIDEFETLTGL